MTYLYVSGIALRCGPLADVPVIRARVVFPSPLLLSLEVKTGALSALVPTRELARTEAELSS
jgi:hypothetical protein